jgi:hypothetical protein
MAAICKTATNVETLTGSSKPTGKPPKFKPVATKVDLSALAKRFVKIDKQATEIQRRLDPTLKYEFSLTPEMGTAQAYFNAQVEKSDDLYEKKDRLLEQLWAAPALSLADRQAKLDVLFAAVTDKMNGPEEDLDYDIKMTKRLLLEFAEPLPVIQFAGDDPVFGARISGPTGRSTSRPANQTETRSPSST